MRACSGLLRQIWLCGLTFALASAAAADEPASPLSPADGLKSLVLPPGFTAELAAAEPEIVDPVAIRFDDRGRMWVVEMRDYPLGPPNGAKPLSRISLLEDKDADGRFETATRFAEELLFPTGLQPWKGGVFVTLSGKIAYLKDTDGDGKCDLNETWFTGFAEANTQLRANHPRLGPDGWIYVANGLKGGVIKNARKPDAPAVTINGMDFKFNPHTGECQAITGNGQFGMTFDDLGNRFVCSNRNPLQQVMFENEHLKRAPHVQIPTVLHDVMAAGEKSKIFPLSRAWTTSNLHAGQFTAACGCLIYRGDALPKEYYGSGFVCDPTGNLVHAEKLNYDAPGVVGTPWFADREFLASKDEWFRPVNLEVGPDGALYVVDMYRAVIEHPEWVPAELKHRPDERLGEDRGRVYRIQASDTSPHRTAVKPEPPRSEAGATFRRLIASPLADAERMPVLSAAVEKHGGERWMRTAILLAAGDHAPELLQHLLEQKGIDPPLLQDLARIDGRLAEKSEHRGNKARAMLLAANSPTAEHLTLITAFLQGNADRREGAEFWPRLMQTAAKIAGDTAAAESTRRAAIELLAFATDERGTLLALASSDQPLRLVALQSFAALPGEEGWKELLASSPKLPPLVRKALLDKALASPARHALLLDAVEAGAVRVTEFDPAFTARLTNTGSPELKARAAKLLAAAVPADRAQVLADYQSALALKGDETRGAASFQKNCAACHKIGETGVNVAPDISDSRTKTTSQLLTDILQPNRAIDNNYLAYMALLEDDTVVSGVLATETATSVTFKVPGGKTVVVPRTDIRELKSTGVSLMPEGLERTIPVAEMADLLAFIKNWRYLDGKTPFQK